MSADAIENTVGEWLVRRREGATPQEEARFQAWLSSDSRHAAAFAKLDAAWHALSQPHAAGQAGIVLNHLALREQIRARRRRAYAFAAGTAAFGAAAALVLSILPVNRPKNVAPSAPPSLVFRPDKRVLPDGSIVELNAGAQVSINMSAEQRRVMLLQGEAMFTVAKDRFRPFVVTTGEVEIRAVGTAFSVRRGSKQIDVLVTEGKVEVTSSALPSQETQSNADAPHSLGSAQPAAGRSRELLLSAGARASVPLGADAARVPRVSRLSDPEIERELDWRDKRVEFAGTALSDAVEWFNRQNRLQISLGDVAIGQRQVTGLFWANDPEGFVRLLESAMMAKAERRQNSIVIRSVTAPQMLD